MTRSLFPAVLASAVCSLLVSAPARALPPEYELHRLGLTGGLFATPAGVETSTAVTMEGGIVAGTSLMTVETTIGGGGGGGGGLGGGIIIIGGGGPITQISNGYGIWLGDAATGVTTRVGLYGAPEFTKSDGVQSGTLLGLSGGVAAGQAIRFNGANGNGEASWIANAATGVSTRIGFFDANYTFSDGSQDTHVTYVQGGYAAGYSSISIAGGGGGSVTWVANGVTGLTTRVGLFGAGYITDSGLQNSTVRGLNGGTVIGESDMYTGENYLGLAAWMTNAATGAPTRLGFTGPAYTRPDGTQLSRAQYVKDGFVSGWSGDSAVGVHQWVSPTTTGVPLRVGLTGGIYKSSDGTELTYADLLSDGYIAGQSYLYYGGSGYMGHAAWVSSAATDTTRRIGFFDSAPYLDSNGRQYSLTTHLTGNYVAGYSRRYNGSAQIGQAVWVAPVAAGNAVRVGLFDPEYTGAFETQSSGINFLKGEYAAGTSNRYRGSTPLGQMAWLADAATGATRPLGLTDAAHTSSGGVQSSWVTHLTATGYVAGSSWRYTGSTFNGQTPWIWDANTSTFEPIIFSIRLDGFATATITQLYDSGLAIGQYELYDAIGTDLGARAFAWTPDDGAFDLNDRVSGGLSAAGWTALVTAGFADPVTGAIVGGGWVPANATTQAVYAAVPAPEPGSTALLALGALGLMGRRRR